MAFEFTTKKQRDRKTSAWSLQTKLAIVIWNVVDMLLFKTSLKPFKWWRNALLRMFGARIGKNAEVARSAKITMPWNLEMHELACIGPNTVIYNLDKIVLEEKATISQESFLCGGTHDFDDEIRPLMTAPICIGKDAFLGVRVLVLPGVRVGNRAIVGAGSVVTKDVPDDTVIGGNPARIIRKRQ